MEPMTCYRHPNRETRVSCAECERGICPDCMVFGPVGIRCPEHAGVNMSAPARAARAATRRSRFLSGAAPVTKALVALNVLVYLAQLAGGADVRASGGWIFEHGALFIERCCWEDGSLAGVAHGEWWRLLTAAFLHAGPIHLAMNMLALWWIGQGLEEYLGSGRYLGLYLVGGLGGSAGAILLSPEAITVGASGAVFGIFGALFVIEQQRAPGQMGPAFTIIVLNLVITFTIPNISIGGHLGGLAGGILGALALTRLGPGKALFGRRGLAGAAALLAIGVASVLVSYWRVRGYA